MLVIKLPIILYGLFLSLSLMIHGFSAKQVTTNDKVGLITFFLIFLACISELYKIIAKNYVTDKKLVWTQTVISFVATLAISPMLLMVIQNTVNLSRFTELLFILPLASLAIVGLLENAKTLYKRRQDNLIEVTYDLHQPQNTNLEVVIETPVTTSKEVVDSIQLGEDETEFEGILDPDRRKFIKMLGVIGAGFLAQTLFNPRQVGAAFFGSVPGPGTIAIKDSTDTKIDPAIKSPTDAYGLTEIDGSVPAYYGFVNKDGNWYIAREEASGSYRYIKGTSNFSTSWGNRAALSYDYFDNVF